MSPRYDVFLSHATADKPQVEYLAQKLRDAGIKPFLDKWHLRPGSLWQTELENGLRDSGTCAIFFGSEEFGPWHQQEMLVALDQGAHDSKFSVIPVLLPGFKKPERIPKFLTQRTWVEFSSRDDEDAFRRLVWGIGGEFTEPEKVSRPYRCMPQRLEEFIPRREYDKVLHLLCPEKGAVQSVGITTALRGAGGFGKTALAQALCQDEKVRETYPDGILWTTMGEEIDANGRLSRIRDLIRWWTDKEAPAFETVTAAGSKLRELLAKPKVLIVIDDVWSPADVTPFQGLENGSALLITTRDSQTLPSGSQRIEVDAMVSAEAVSLLRTGLLGGEKRDFVDLAARLGEWPLLLKLVNRQLRDLVNEERQSIPTALREINGALDYEGFAAFDRDDPESRQAAASRTVLVSIEKLPEKDRERYFQLAVFPEDVEIPTHVLEKFWGLRDFQVRKLCRRLHDLSLLLEFDVESGTLRLHDVIRRVLIEQIGEQLSKLHSHLLDTFRPASGLWSDLPMGERYLWRNLAGHLLGAERKDELRQLLTDFSFLQAKLNATDVNGLMADYRAFIEERELRLIQDALRLSVAVDGLRAISGSFDGTLRVWDLETGETLRILEGHSRGVSAVALVGGCRAVSGSSDRTLRVWDLETGETLAVVTLDSAIWAVAVSQDGQVVVVGDARGKVSFLDLVEPE